ncbi:hypothetical protein ABT294_32215 [Nonomuraea sp. NPDC000554]|uniref:hypothetical protein n=1 Tax=Nonomuraea sp. NPDC000554 TaxID=3154259 RepID=UPI00331CFC4F
MRFLLEEGLSEARTQIVWDAIALHTSSGIANWKGPVAEFAQQGIALDIGGQGTDRLPPGFADEAHARFPRLGVEDALADAIVSQVLANPAKGMFMTLPG